MTTQDPLPTNDLPPALPNPREASETVDNIPDLPTFLGQLADKLDKPAPVNVRNLGVQMLEHQKYDREVQLREALGFHSYQTVLGYGSTAATTAPQGREATLEALRITVTVLGLLERALELLDKSEASFPRAKLLAHCIAGEEQILTALWEGYAMERVIRG